MTIQVNQERCNGCGNCVSICPSNAIRLEGGRAIIDEALCVGCQACMDACAQSAIAFVEVQSPLVQRAALATPQMEVLPAWPTPTRNKATVPSALAFAAGDILPLLAKMLLNVWERKLAQPHPIDGHIPSYSTLAPVSRRLLAGRHIYRRRARHGRQEMERSHGRR